jgi:hypothetical protein
MSAVKGYEPVPAREKYQLCDGQKVLLLAVVYGELSTMVPFHLVHPPFDTAPEPG